MSKMTLIVDDKAIDAAALKAFLEEKYAVTQADDGGETVCVLRQKPAPASAFGLELPSGQQLSDREFTAGRLNALFEDINGGVSVVVYADDGTVRHAYANERYYQLFGYTKQQFAAELKDPHDTTHAEDRAEVAQRFAAAKATKQAASFRYRVVKRDKSIAHVRCNLSFTTIEGISGYVLISILTDITESVQAEQQAIIMSP